MDFPAANIYIRLDQANSCKSAFLAPAIEERVDAGFQLVDEYRGLGSSIRQLLFLGQGECFFATENMTDQGWYTTR